MAWLSSVTAGHTKRITVNAIAFCAYCIGNGASPFMWQAKYYPRYVTSCFLVWLLEPNASLVRNHVPWTVIGVCHVACIITLLVIRWHLARENRRRDLEPRDHTYDDNWVEMIRDDGTVEKIQVPKVFTPDSCLIVCLMFRCRSTWTSRTFKIAIFAMSCSSFLGL